MRHSRLILFFLSLSVFLSNQSFSSEMEKDFEHPLNFIAIEVDKEILYTNLTAILNSANAIEEIMLEIQASKKMKRRDQINLEINFSNLKKFFLQLTELIERKDLKIYIEKMPSMESQAKIKRWFGSSFRDFMFCHSSPDPKNRNYGFFGCCLCLPTLGVYPALIYLTSALINLAQASAIAATCCSEIECLNVERNYDYDKKEWESTIDTIKMSIVRIAAHNGLQLGAPEYWEETKRKAGLH